MVNVSKYSIHGAFGFCLRAISVAMCSFFCSGGSFKFKGSLFVGMALPTSLTTKGEVTEM